MTPQQPLVLRVAAPRELLESLPHLVGFVPYESLVLVLLRTVGDSSRERVELTVRIDLPVPAGGGTPPMQPVLCGSEAFTSAVDRALSASGADTVVVVAWGPAPAAGVVPPALEVYESFVAADVRACTGLFEGRGVKVRDALVVSGDRFRSMLCSDTNCCPGEGVRLSTPQSSAVSARVVASGRPMPASDRDTLKAEVAAEGTRVDATARALGAKAQATTHDLVRPEAIPGLPQPATQVSLLCEAMRRWSATGEVAPEVMADVAVALGRGTVREHAVRWMLDGVDGLDQRRFWLYLTRGVPRPFDACCAALAAMAALLEGNGAAANIALEYAVDALDASAEPADENVFSALVANVEYLVGGGCSPEMASTILSSAYAWFTPVAVPTLASAQAVRRASAG